MSGASFSLFSFSNTFRRKKINRALRLLLVGQVFASFHQGKEEGFPIAKYYIDHKII
ncbi:MAG: hypothetical protein ACJAUH_001715 [Saprospiraceae bacterium]